MKLACPSHSGLGAALHLRPMTTFMLLVSFQLVIGVSLFVIGLSAFTYTPSYRIGSFWAGFIVSQVCCSMFNDLSICDSCL